MDNRLGKLFGDNCVWNGSMCMGHMTEMTRVIPVRIHIQSKHLLIPTYVHIYLAIGQLSTNSRTFSIQFVSNQ